MTVYQDRLNHEYDKGWEQVRITTYVSAGVVIALAWVLRDAPFPVRHTTALVRAVCLFGLLISVASLVNQIGSQLDARDLRRALAELEAAAAPSYYAVRTRFWNPAGAALLLIGVAIVCLWVAGIAFGPGILSQSHP